MYWSVIISPPQRFHVCGGLLHGSTAALLVLLAGQSLRGQGHAHGRQKGSGGPADRLTNNWVVVLFRWEYSFFLYQCMYTHISVHLGVSACAVFYLTHTHNQAHTHVRQSLQRQRLFFKTWMRSNKRQRLSISEAEFKGRTDAHLTSGYFVCCRYEPHWGTYFIRRIGGVQREVLGIL